MQFAHIFNTIFSFVEETIVQELSEEQRNDLDSSEDLSTALTIASRGGSAIEYLVNQVTT